MKDNKKGNKKISDRIAFIAFIASLTFSIMGASFIYGVAVGKYQYFPYKFLDDAAHELRRLLNKSNPPWYFTPESEVKRVFPSNTQDAYDGLNLVTQLVRTKNGISLRAQVVDMQSNVLHNWEADWFKIWPDATHLPEFRMPKERPGTHIHGAALLEDGSLVYNYEFLGLVRLDVQGVVVWRLPYQTHHSVHVSEDGNLWVPGLKFNHVPDQRFPNRLAPFEESTILEVSPTGEIINEWSVPEILYVNGLEGLMYLESLAYQSRSFDDILHLNDVEPFPTTMMEDFFTHSDVMISLRNINTVLVFDRNSKKIKFICTGWFVGQHDPDFIDGNTFSVFDNNDISPDKNFGHQSKIVIVKARERKMRTYFEGREDAPFLTNILGKHQWLPNGNLLITESVMGRAFEINKEGKVVWEYVNKVADDMVGATEEVKRVSSEFGKFYRN